MMRMTFTQCGVTYTRRPRCSGRALSRQCCLSAGHLGNCTLIPNPGTYIPSPGVVLVRVSKGGK